MENTPDDEPSLALEEQIPEHADCESLTAANFLRAMDSNDPDVLSNFVFLSKHDPRPDYEGEDCFMSHRGPGTKRDLVVPLAKTLRELYDFKFFVDCEPVNKLSRNALDLDKGEVIRHSLWKCRVILVFLSRDFHNSKWCLLELYTALCRQRMDLENKDFVLRIIFCDDMDPDKCDEMPAYAGLDLGGNFGVLSEPYTYLEDFAVGLHPTVREIISTDDEASPLSPASEKEFLTKWRRHCPLKARSNNLKNVNPFHLKLMLLGFMLLLGGIVVMAVKLSNRDEPTPSPPTFPPSPPPTFDPRTQSILSLIQSKTLSNGSPLRYPTSFVSSATLEEQALEWVMDDDPAQLEADSPGDQNRILQRYALATLWFLERTTADEWGNASDPSNTSTWGLQNWLSDAHECEWHMVICEEKVLDATKESALVIRGLSLHDQGFRGRPSSDLTLLSHLTVLDLSGNELSGPFPSGITELTALTALRFNGNALIGPIPKEIGRLTNLQILNLSVNDWLNGTIPTTVGQLTELDTMDLSFNNLSGPIPPEISRLTNLESLILRNNSLTNTIPEDIVQLSMLRTLDVSSNNLMGQFLVEGVSSNLGLLPMLRSLQLSFNEFSGPFPSVITQMVSLTDLRLDSNAFTGLVPNEIGQLINLEFLDLGENFFNGTIPSNIGALVQLTALRLFANQLSSNIPSSISALTKLKFLDFSSNKMSGDIPSTIGQLSQLVSLNITNNNLRGPIPDAIADLTNLTLLSLDTNGLTGAIPNGVGQLTQLTYLSFHSNQLVGSIPNEIASLTNLIHLSFDTNSLNGKNGLTGSIPTGIGELTYLTHLAFNGNSLSGPIPDEIASLTNLSWLTFSRNGLNGTIPTDIGELSQLDYVSFHFNRLSGPIPDEIGSLTNLVSLLFISNRLSGTIPTEVAKLTNLELLSMRDNQLSGPIPSDIGKLSQLTYLNVKSNDLSGPIPGGISLLTNLETLDMSINPRLDGTIPSSITDLPRLARFLSYRTN